jgi:fucose permease
LNAKTKATLGACYVGYIVQAVVVNLVPVIFIPLREQFSLSYIEFGTLVLVNFIAQVLIDITLSHAVDKYGTRRFVVTAHFLCTLGLIGFALAPVLFPNRVFVGLLVGSVLFASSGGLLELCLSPIVDAIEPGDSSKMLSLLHSFYAWGQVGVILLTTILLFLGVSWVAITLLWAVIPCINGFLFLRVKIIDKAQEGNTLKIRELFKSGTFIRAALAILFGGAAEVILAQYASSFLEKGLGLPKVMGDTLGLCGFAVFLGIGRTIYGLMGEKLNLRKVLIYGSLLAFGSYLVIVFSPSKIFSVVAIALCGLFVSLLWPGTLAIASKQLPLAGASMFALLAGAGDIGGAVGPWIVGVATEYSMKWQGQISTLSPEEFGLRAGVLLGAIFPIASFIAQIRLTRHAKKSLSPQ